MGSLQFLLDEGKDLDWFASREITALAITAAVCFAAFIIWELYEEHPVVDLRVFRHRGFSVSVLTISLAFGAFFGANVLTPLWLQSLMGYTATKAGQATAWSGLTAMFLAPLVAQMASRFDPRKLVFGGVLLLGAVTLWRSTGTTDMTFWDVAIPLMAMGLGLPFFFIPTTGLAMASPQSSGSHQNRPGQWTPRPAAISRDWLARCHGFPMIPMIPMIPMVFPWFSHDSHDSHAL